VEVALLVFAITLLVAVLLSERASRTALSIPALFIAAGIAVGPGGFAFVDPQLESEGLPAYLELALFVVLFVDGMHIDLRALRSSWRLAGRVLFIGLPLTMLFTTILGLVVAGLGWLQALLVAAVLGPTDSMFAPAIVQRKEASTRLRRLLNVESGLNDGVALPIVLTILAYAGAEEFELLAWLGELALGILLGVAVAWIVIRLETLSIFNTESVYSPLLVVTIGVLLYALCRVLHANLFLAAFSAGVGLATFSPRYRDEITDFGGIIAELFKLSALFAFGTLLSLRFFWEPGWQVIIFALLVILVARPVAVLLVIRSNELSWRERLTAAWFGPRGFISVIYGLIVLGSGVAEAGELFRAIATVIVISIVAHSSTDSLVARWLNRGKQEAQERLSSEAAD
jgi:NhaP-type Na+/H+ or K+/H+ antiporter